MIMICIEMAILFITSALIMMLHEFPKSLIFAIRSQVGLKEHLSVFRIWRYIDPIGMVFSVLFYAPISRPYMFRVSKKETNFLLGCTGFLTLFLIYGLSIFVLRYEYGGLSGIEQMPVDKITLHLIFAVFWQYVALLSAGMIITNLFPVSTFDLGLLVARISPHGFFWIIKADGLVKMILLLAMLLHLVRFPVLCLVRFCL